MGPCMDGISMGIIEKAGNLDLEHFQMPSEKTTPAKMPRGNDSEMGTAVRAALAETKRYEKETGEKIRLSEAVVDFHQHEKPAS